MPGKKEKFYCKYCKEIIINRFVHAESCRTCADIRKFLANVISNYNIRLKIRYPDYLFEVSIDFKKKRGVDYVRQFEEEETG